MKNLINWHKRKTKDFQKFFKISDYGMLWFANIEGFLIGLLVGIIISFAI